MNILQGNITKTLIITFILGVVISLVLGPITIPLLRRLKFGQNIREDGPKTHLKKAGTPTMGGVIFILSTIFKVDGVWLTYVVTELITSIITIILKRKSDFSLH